MTPPVLATSSVPAYRSLLPITMLLIIAVCFLYGPAVLGNNYAWDDWELFINSPYLRNPALILEGLVKPIIPGTTYFRPLPLATFALEFSLGSVNPVISHAVNLLMHVGNTVLVGIVFFKIYSPSNNRLERYGPVVAMVIYALHPALVEPVAWAAGRFDLMVTFFYLTVVAVYLSFSGVQRILLILPLYLAACFSKEMAVTLPVALLLIEYYRTPKEFDLRSTVKAVAVKTAPSLLVMGAVGIFYLSIKYHFMGKIAHADAEVLKEFKGGSIDHLAFVGQTLFFYVKMALWPFSDLSPHHPFVVSKMTVLQKCGGIVFMLIFLSGLAYAALRRSIAGIFVVLAILCLFPVLNVVPLTIGGNIGHERFLTLPLAFFSMAVAAFVFQAPASIAASKLAVPVIVGISVIWLALAGLNIKVTAPLWKNDLTLWKWAYDSNPDFYVANIGYAGAAVRYQQFELASQILEHAKGVPLRGRENTLPASILEARLLGRAGHFVEAAEKLEQAMDRLKETYKVDALKNNRVPQFVLGRQLSAIYYTALSEAYAGANEFEKARVNAQLATHYSPKYPLGWFYLALSSYGLNDWVSGEKEYSTAKGFMVDYGLANLAIMRSDFLTKLCLGDSSSKDVCSRSEAHKR